MGLTSRLLLAAVILFSAGNLYAQNQLTIQLSDNQPAGLTTDGTANQTVMRFMVFADGSDVTIREMFFDIVLGGALASGDVTTATLYEDTNGDGGFDPGEEITPGTLNQAVAADSVMFDLDDEDIATADTRNWVVAVTFAGAAADVGGTIETTLPADGVVVTTPTMTEIFGLPISTFVAVSGSIDSLVIVVQPTDTQEDESITPAVVVELRDMNDNVVLGQSIEIAATIQSGPSGAVLYGSTTTNVNPGTGRATFFDLRLDRPGAPYVLRFSAGSVTEDSAIFEVTQAPGLPKHKSGGGCTAEYSDNMLPALALLIPALVLVTWAARRYRR
ncbi:MAG: hypothetical protein IT462_10835 [Planctomycetes bacterium]|nr:hypothetical protein [Planctomycetota bacterium]